MYSAIVKRLIAAILLVLSGISFAQQCSVARAVVQTVPERYRFIFLIDLSKSMVGVGGSPNIFPRVQRELQRFARTLPEGTEVRLITFDAGPTSDRSFTLPGELDRYLAHVRSLRATGTRTYINRTLKQTVMALRPDERTATLLYLFTDGRDNDSQTRLQDFTRIYQLQRGPHDWLYYLTLGIDVPAEVRAALAPLGRTQALSAAPGTIPALTVSSVRPATLHLGNLHLEPEPSRALEVRTQGGETALQLAVRAPELERHGALLSVTPGRIRSGVNDLRFTLANAANLPEGTYHATLCVQGPDGSMVTPAAVSLELAFHPAARYALEPQSPLPDTLSLFAGQTATLDYTVGGNRWATEAITVRPGTLPDGLSATVNGAASATVRPGDTVRLALENAGELPRDLPQPLALEVEASPGAQVAPVPLPTVTQPPTFLERWGLLLALAALLVLAILMGLWWTGRPWGVLEYDGARHRLRGRTAILPRTAGDLAGLSLERPGARARGPRLLAVPSDIELIDEGYMLEVQDHLEWDTAVAVRSYGKPAGSFTVSRI
nr:vWA domain-containing protein [Deinobacterium chartae]